MEQLLNEDSDKEPKSKTRNIKIAKILTISFAILLFLNFLLVSILFSWADWLAILIFSLLFIVPAYLSNAGMVIVAKFKHLAPLGRPIDKGKICKDGRRITGDHKTWRGLIFGPLYIGIPISIGISLLFYVLWPFIEPIIQAGIDQGIYQLYNDISYYEFYFLGGPYPIGILMLILRIILISYGACVGDLIGSFLKRRVNIKSGEPFWIIDQLDFAAGALLLGSIPLLFLSGLYLAPDIHVIIFLLILTPSVSLIANTIAYLTRLKDVPW